MSLFLKDPKTCMNPWRGLTIIVVVCSFVLIALLIGEKRHSLSVYQNQQTMSSQTTVLPIIY